MLDPPISPEIWGRSEDSQNQYFLLPALISWHHLCWETVQLSPVPRGFGSMHTVIYYGLSREEVMREPYSHCRGYSRRWANVPRHQMMCVQHTHHTLSHSGSGKSIERVQQYEERRLNESASLSLFVTFCRTFRTVLRPGWTGFRFHQREEGIGFSFLQSG